VRVYNSRVRRAELLDFIRIHKYAVEASVSAAARPQAALVGIAVTRSPAWLTTR
jgi:hypothetical protein